MGIIHIMMGPYLLKTNFFKIENGRAIIFVQLEDKKILFPKNVEFIPDLIFYFADKDEEYRRHSFCRVKASEILDKSINKLLQLTEDRSLNLIEDDEFGGFMSV